MAYIYHKKNKSNHCMMMVLASAQIDNILSKKEDGDHDNDDDKDIIMGRINVIEYKLKQIKKNYYDWVYIS